MPIKILDDLPVKKLLLAEDIFSMDEQRAIKQDIRPLRLLILNLMPKKMETELQLLRLISQSPLQIDVEFLQTQTHEAKHTSQTYLQTFYKTFYKTFDDIKSQRYDGMIVTGAPVEQLQFEEVDYWGELTDILDWAQENVTSIVHICWGAQAGLYHYYGIEKTHYKEKLFGIYENKVTTKHPLVRGFSDYFDSPQSRYTGINYSQISQAPLVVLSESIQLGPLMFVSNDDKNVFILGHLEYDANTLYEEYLRDQEKQLGTQFPNYYEKIENTNQFKQTWRSEASLFYQNWLNLVYQITPYDWVIKSK